MVTSVKILSLSDKKEILEEVPDENNQVLDYHPLQDSENTVEGQIGDGLKGPGILPCDRHTTILLNP